MFSAFGATSAHVMPPKRRSTHNFGFVETADPRAAIRALDGAIVGDHAIVVEFERRRRDAAPVRVPSIDSLCDACESGRTAAVISLIDRGADINARRESDGATPLHCASWNGHSATAVALIDRGADIGSRRS